MQENKWSAAETAFLKQCLDKRMSRKQIARHFPDRTLLAIKAKVAWERRQKYEAAGGHLVVRSKEVPLELIAERDRRANEPRASGGMMGEPPFSQSALGKLPAVGPGEVVGQ